MSGTAIFGYFVFVGLPFIAGLLGAWQAYKHRLRGEGIWKMLVLLTVIAFVGVVLISIALSPLGGYAFSQYRVPGWAILGAALAWFLLPLMVGSIFLYKANKLMKQRNRKWIIYFAAGTPLTFVIPAIGLLVTWLIAEPPPIVCYVPVIRENFLYDNVLTAGMLLKRKVLLTRFYKGKKINKEVYEKIKRTFQ